MTRTVRTAVPPWCWGPTRVMAAVCVLVGLLALPTPAASADANRDSLASCGGFVSLGSSQPYRCWATFAVEDITQVLVGFEPGTGYTGTGGALLCKVGEYCANLGGGEPWLHARFVAGIADPRFATETNVTLEPGTWDLYLEIGHAVGTNGSEWCLPRSQYCLRVPDTTSGASHGALEVLVRLSEEP